jgi:hypothetical protein
MKKCSRCQLEKDESEFYVNRTRNNLQTNCKSCGSVHAKNWLKNNKDRELKRRKEYYQKNKDRIRELSKIQHLRHTYGLSVEQYEEMLAKQNNLCAICNGPPTGRYNKLVIDHCHTTNQVRGLLCNECNTLLGLAKDKIEILQSAIQYLTKNGNNE